MHHPQTSRYWHIFEQLLTMVLMIDSGFNLMQLLKKPTSCCSQISIFGSIPPAFMTYLQKNITFQLTSRNMLTMLLPARDFVRETLKLVLETSSLNVLRVPRAREVPSRSSRSSPDFQGQMRLIATSMLQLIAPEVRSMVLLVRESAKHKHSSI